MASDWKHYQDTGYGPIDAEHRMISEGLEHLLGAFNGGRVQEVEQVLERLNDQFKSHFDHEERLMQESGYPMLDRHKEAHDSFLVDAAKYLLELQDKGLSDPFRRWMTGRALEWFRFHIAANDVGLGRFLQAREEAMVAAIEVEVAQP